MDYKNGKVYRIVSNVSGKQYVGSTTQPLSKRLSYHKSGYSQWKKGKHHYYTSFEVIEEGDYDIVLVEECPCENREQLHRRERHWIETVECVNKRVEGRTKEEWTSQNRDKVLESQRKYLQKNRDTVLENKRKYYQSHKDTYKNYVEQHKKWSVEKVVCACGCEVSRGNLATHRKSKKPGTLL